jgi:hypothetical protein
MANITTILGTDSVSSSRVTLNDNFASINQELGQISALLDILNETITLSGLAKFGSLNIADGKLIANNTSITSTVATTINETFTMNQDVIYSVLTGVTSLPAAGSFNSSTYVLDAATIVSSGISQPLSLNAGLNGQEITLISDGDELSIAVNNINGPSAVTILNNGTLTLRCAGSKWYVVSSYDVTF